jgi:hypothetical protein
MGNALNRSSDMTTAAVMAVIASGIGFEQPLHPAAQAAIGSGADHQMDWLGHQAVPDDIHGNPGAGVDDGLDAGVVVSGLVENCLAAVAAVVDVIPHAANGGSGSSWHAIGVMDATLALNISIFVMSPFPRRLSEGVTGQITSQ